MLLWKICIHNHYHFLIKKKNINQNNKIKKQKYLKKKAECNNV